MSQSVSVVSSQNTTTEVQITAARAQQATKIYEECCKKLAEIIKSDPESYGLSGEVSVEDLIALIPKPTFKVKSKSKTSKKSKPKKIKYTLDNWQEVTEKDQLKSLKTKDLKNILSEKSMAISGNKSTLLDRVWGILHPDQAPVEAPKKKRGRKSSKKKEVSAVTIEDSDTEVVNEQEDVQTMLDNRESVYFDSNNQLVSDKTDGCNEFQLVKEKGWVFKEDEENFEFAGLLQNGKLMQVDPPQELCELFSEE